VRNPSSEEKVLPLGRKKEALETLLILEGGTYFAYSITGGGGGTGLTRGQGPHYTTRGREQQPFLKKRKRTLGELESSDAIS